MGADREERSCYLAVGSRGGTRSGSDMDTAIGGVMEISGRDREDCFQ